MKSFVFILLALSLVSNASFLNHQHRAGHLMSRHQGRASSLTQRSVEKRCKNVRSKPEKLQPSSTSSSQPAPTKSSSSGSKGGSKQSNNNNSQGSDTSIVGIVNGLLHASSSCGNSGATEKITANSGPNGNMDFLNCGINGGGWNPPDVKIEQLIVADLDSALADPNTPFKACKPYIDIFKSQGQANGIPPIMLASFAMQESSCNPDTVGGAGEQGLMQITKDKCGGAPGGNCKDPWYNISTAAKYFADQLKNNGYNVLQTVGGYNGWNKGMTYNDATAARWTNCCRCQRNLDYLHQFFNGWCQNKNAYDLKLGVFFNLNVC